MEEREGPEDEDEEVWGAERDGKEAPGGGSVRSKVSSFCIRRFSLAACAIFFLNFGMNESSVFAALSFIVDLRGDEKGGFFSKFELGL